MPVVAYDARELRHSSGLVAGVSRYVRGLIGAVAREEPRLTLRVHLWAGVEPPQAWEGLPNIHIHTMRRTGLQRLPFIWPHIVFPRDLSDRAEMVHAPAASLPLGRLQAPAIVSVHDLAIYEHPEWYPAGQWLSLKLAIPSTMRRAALILCGSQRTAREVGRLFPSAAARTRVVPYGFDPRLQHAQASQDALQRLRAKVNLPARYVLAVGTVEPRKGYSFLMEAFGRIAAEMPDTGVVIAGGRGWRCDDILDLPARLQLTDRVRLLGHVSDEDLAVLMAGAEMLAMPSLDEGFGLPVLEAMAAGVPVLASHAGAIPEVTADAALLVQPGDVDALRAGLRRMFQDAELRANLAAAGRERAKLFSWEACARGTLRAYREAGLRL
jgi:glycosyltransferase involved in cell wall biosynthesis